MDNIFQFAMTLVAIPIVILWIFMAHHYGEKYQSIIQTINPEEYRYPELFGVGFGLLELIHYDMTSAHATAQIKKISEMKGKKYAAYYYYVMLGEKISYAVTILPY